MKRTLTALALAAAAFTASADMMPTHAIVHIGSQHDKAGFNDFNPGFGLRWADAQGDGPAVGMYHNSDRKLSVYGVYVWTWAVAGKVSASVAAGVVTGYIHNPTVMLVPSVAYQVTDAVAARLTLAPAVVKTGASALHLSVEYKF